MQLKKISLFPKVICSIENPFICDAMQLIDGDLNLSSNIYWSPEQNSEFLIGVAGDDLNEIEAKAMGYTQSSVGFYKYIRKFIVKKKLEITFPVSTKITSIKIMPWRYKGDVTLIDMEFTYVNKVDIKVTLNSFDPSLKSDKHQSVDFYESNRSDPIFTQHLKANLFLKKMGCGKDCYDFCNRWYHAMDLTARTITSDNYGRSNHEIKLDNNENITATTYNQPTATIALPDNIDSYLYKIGDKSRNTIKKAEKKGYQFRPIDPDLFLDDIVDIRTSDPQRQGRFIPKSFYEKPESLPIKNPSNCFLHQESFYGVFLVDKLVSFISILTYGELAKINHIMCHSDHMKYGVMNLNLCGMISHLMESNSIVKFINYLYFSKAGNSSLDSFKKSTGFNQGHLLVYDAESMFEEYKKPSYQPITSTSKKNLKSEIKIEKSEFIITSATNEESLSAFFNRFDKAIIKLDPYDSKEIAKYLGGELNLAVENYPVSSYFALPFFCRFKSNSNSRLSLYLERRFKSNPINEAGFCQGFKGSRFQAVGFIEYQSINFLFDGYLVIKKIK